MCGVDYGVGDAEEGVECGNVDGVVCCAQEGCGMVGRYDWCVVMIVRWGF